MRRALISFLLAFAATAIAGTVVTETPGPSQLKSTDGSTNITFQVKDGLPSPHVQCVNAAVAAFKGPDPQTVTCWDSVKVTLTPDCEGTKPPTIPLTKDADGNWLEPDARAEQGATDNDWKTTQFLYVHNAAWPSGVPNCWVRGWTDPDGWRINGTNAAAPFMEQLQPGMTALEYPNSVEPMAVPPDVEAEWELPESCTLRHQSGTCYPPGSPGETCGPCPPGVPVTS